MLQEIWNMLQQLSHQNNLSNDTYLLQERRLFCLEYKIKPAEIEMELRIYQSDEILYHKPTVEDIVPIMDRIVTSDKIFILDSELSFNKERIDESFVYPIFSAISFKEYPFSRYHKPTVEDIVPIMDRIVTSDKIIAKIRAEEA